MFFVFSIIILHSIYDLKKLKISGNLKVVQIKKELKKKNPNLLIKKYKEFLMNLPHYNHSNMRSKKIFWFWFQGEKNASNLVKVCLNSVFRNCKSHEINIINKKNVNEYVHFPHFIINKLKKKSISITHFSDLLRLELLIKYGGTWIDSTVLITKYNDIFFNNDLFFFQTTKQIHSAGSSWFITAEKESPILRTTRDLLYQYWSKNSHLFHYFLFHFFFKMAYDKYQKEYKNMPNFLSSIAHKLQWELFNPFNKTKYKEILKNSSIHKLTRKRKTNLTNGLYYHHIIEEFNSIK